MILFRRFGAPRSRSRSRGQSLAEFALVLPVLLLIVMIGLDFGRVFLGWVNLNQAARIGANYAGQNPNANWTDTSSGSARDRYSDLIQGDAAAINCDLDTDGDGTADIPAPAFSATPPNLGDTVTVTITCEFRLLTPLISAILPNPLPVSAAAEWPIRTGSVGGTASGPGPVPTPTPTPVPGATPTPTPAPTPTPTPVPGATPTPTPVATPPPAPVADFYGTPTSPNSSGGGIGGAAINGVAPLAVTFTSNSSGTVDTYAWNFGDGGGSNDQNASYTYPRPGRYQVALTAANSGGSDTEAKNNYVEVGCQIPDLQGLTESQARDRWDAAGFQPSNLTFDPSPFGNRIVQRQTQPGGNIVAYNRCASTRMSAEA